MSGSALKIGERRERNVPMAGTFLRTWVLALVLLAIIGGCASPRVLQSAHSGECMELLVPHFLYKPGLAEAYSGEFMISPERMLPTETRRIAKVGELAPGTRVVVHEVMEKPKILTWPDYLRITVRISSGEFNGLVADVPACVPFHPQRKWLVACTMDPNALQFEPELVKACVG